MITEFIERHQNRVIRQKLVSSCRTGRKCAGPVRNSFEAQFPEPVWAVPDLIPAGLTFLAGRPKLGKSWMALQIAHAKAIGGVVFGHQVEKGKVLYLAFQVSERRLQARHLKQGIPPSEDMVFFTQWHTLNGGGLAELQTEIEHGGYQLVVIDTLSKALGKADQLDPAEMTMVIGNLQYLSQSMNIAILVVDHHRKSNGF